MITKEGWIGANSKEDAKDRIKDKFPGCTIEKLYEKLSGMWAYVVKEQEKEQEEIAAVPFQEEEPSEDEPDTLDSEV